MSKSTKFPSYSGGAVSINGNNIANTSRKGNTVTSSYNMGDTEKKIYNSIQNNMSNTLDNLFTISDPQRTEWQNQLNAMQNIGLQNINDIYTPLQNSLKNDIASRFGNLDNSVFLDKLSSITNNKSKAIADLANNLTLAQSDLYNQEIQNRMNMLNLLSNLNNTINGNILNYLNLANQNSNSGNQYNQAAYRAALAKQQQLQNSITPMATLGTGALDIYGTVSGNNALTKIASRLSSYL